MWEMEYNRSDGGVYKTNRWCAGTIKDFSDGSTIDPASSRRKKLGMGWLWIVYDDGTGGWLLATRPTFYKANKPGGWRLVKSDDDMGDDSDNEDEDEPESDAVSDADLVDAPGDDDMSDDDDFDDV